jgi:ParB family transcriptional regulator, chromosome partitioning protein
MMSKSNNNKQQINKGLSSLLGGIKDELKAVGGGSLKPSVVEAITNITRIPLDKIEPNPNQPRKDFDKEALAELVNSIKMHDIIQPITVSKQPNGKYIIVSGERRFRASKEAGLTDIPAYIRQVNDQQLLELALLENLQREDLNAIEVALSYKRMMDELDYTQEKVGERMGKDRTTITNYLRLLKLPPAIQLSVRNNEISMGHAKCLINIEAVEKQLFLFKEIKAGGLNVRQTEDLVRNMNKSGQVTKTVQPKAVLAPAYQKIQDKIASQFGTKVIVKHGKKGNGSISFEYYSLQELNKLLDAWQVTVS